MSLYANYHIALKNRRFDPYAGLGLGYSLVRVSASSVDGTIDGSSTRGSSVFALGHVGALIQTVEREHREEQSDDFALLGAWRKFRPVFDLG